MAGGSTLQGQKCVGVGGEGGVAAKLCFPYLIRRQLKLENRSKQCEVVHEM